MKIAMKIFCGICFLIVFFSTFSEVYDILEIFIEDESARYLLIGPIVLLILWGARMVDEKEW
jgi:hypothetical protein